MNIFLDFLIENYILLIMLVGMAILTIFDVFLEKKMLIRLRVTLILIFSLALFGYLEDIVALMGPTDAVITTRILLSALCYSLRPIILMMLVFIAYREAHWTMVIPAALNIILSFSAFFTDIVFGFYMQNSFYRGPLGYTPYVVSILYILVLFFISFRVLANHSIEEGSIILFLSAAAAIAALLTVLGYTLDIDLLYGAEILLYYLYLYGQYTKCDALTGLLNRQSFYCDFEKFSGSMSGIVSIDMNDLKWLNDNYGHSEGDKALKTVSECFKRHTSSKDRVYRIGGDEFVAICMGHTPDEMEKLVADMRAEVNETGYMCAFGLSVGMTADEMMKEADEKMYADKERMKAEALVTGNEVHFRS